MNQSSQPTPPSKEAIECAKAICYSLNVDYSNTTALRVQLAIDKAIKEGGYVKEESYIEIDKYIKEAQENQQLLSLLHAKDEALKEVQRNYGLELSAEHLRQVDSALSLTPSDAAKMFVPVESVKPLINALLADCAYSTAAVIECLDAIKNACANFPSIHGDKFTSEKSS